VRVTGLRETGRGGVVVETDGRPWRELPADVIVRAEIRVDRELDRARLRTVARELRRHRALTEATRRLRRRDLSSRRLDTELARRGVRAPERAEAIGVLGRAGLLDDERLGHSRATALARRALGDAAILWNLEREGIDRAVALRAVEALEPERERAERLVQARGRSPRTARFLAAKGFAEDVVEAVAGADDAGALG
jgi:SOS response regulatory protein OraA/RecX